MFPLFWGGKEVVRAFGVFLYDSSPSINFFAVN